MQPTPRERPAEPDEAALVARACARDADAIRQIMHRHNQRLYRLARGIMRNDADAEEVVQDAWLHALHALDTFRGEAALGTWLGRIAINTALTRLRAQRRQRRAQPPAGAAEAAVIPFPHAAPSPDTERIMAQREILDFVERAADSLPDPFRLVFMARVVEGLDQAETAALLGVPETTVRTRLHRARRMIRDRVEEQIGPIAMEAFPFAGHRCARMIETVLARMGLDG